MKDEKDRLLSLRKDYSAFVAKTQIVERDFLAVHCRYRNDNATCGHGRFTMKKYPQHMPRPVACMPGVCPRN